MQPKVFNKHHGDTPVGAVHVGRSTKWGNPFIIGTHGSRNEVILKFVERLIARKDDLVPVIQKELKGKHLECFCAPNLCHGDVLLAVANCSTEQVDTILETARLKMVELTCKTIEPKPASQRQVIGRAKPFNQKVRDAVPFTLEVINDNIEYLKTAKTPTAPVRTDQLQTVHDWLASHLEHNQHD